jgi:tetratricopeptide (TPR) repeat protein
LLSEAELTLFARLSVFAGGCTVEGAEAVCNPDGVLDVLEGLAALVDQSLLRQEGEDEPRFLMLETIRQYATERLEDSGAADSLRQQHASFFLAFAERVAREIEGPNQARWLERLEAEHDNLRAALRWSLDQGQAEIALRLAIALDAFWMVHNHWSEGRRWLEEALNAGVSLSPALRVRGLRVTAGLAVQQSDFRAARRWCEQSLALAEQLRDSSARAAALSTLAGLAGREGDYRAARALYDESLALSQELGDKEGMCEALHRSGWTALLVGDHSKVEPLIRESVALARELGNTHTLALCLRDLGDVARARGELDPARTV